MGSPEQQKKLAVSNAGDKSLAASDLGWKDTVLVWPGETVCIAIDFTHPINGDQVYMIHCHSGGNQMGAQICTLHDISANSESTFLRPFPHAPENPRSPKLLHFQ